MLTVCLAVVIVLVLLAGGSGALLAYGPRLQAAQERERVDGETRFAQWRLQQATSAALQRLLDEARQP